jgi:hypothetical protein
MAHLIDKDALVAEIEKIIDILIKNSGYIGAFGENQITVYEDVLSLINTLEVKEVDINKEISQFIDANFEKATIGHKLSLRRTAKHFFKLGLKAKKGE